MTAPVAPPPSRFQADFLTVSMVIIYALTVVMAFVLFQQHPEQGYTLPAFLEGILIAGLPIIFAYRANNPTQTAAVGQVAAQLGDLAERVDLNHLDTTQQLADLPTVPVIQPDPEPPKQQAANAEGALYKRLIQDPPAIRPDIVFADPPPDPDAATTDELLNHLHAQAAAEAPAPAGPASNAPPVVR